MRALVRASGVLAAGGPLLSLLGEALHPGLLDRALSPAWLEGWPLWLLWLSSALVSLGGLVLQRARDLGRNLVVAGVGAWCIQGVLPALEEPTLVLAALAGVAILMHLLFPATPTTAERIQEAIQSGVVQRARAACLTALLGWALIWLGGIAPDPSVLAAHGASLLLASLLVVRASGRPQVRRWVRGVFAVTALVGLAGVAAFSLRFLPTLAFASLLPLAGLALLRSTESRLGALLVDVVASHPARLLAVTFLGLSAAGAVLLRLPVSSAGALAVDGIDAAFTATSAVCVTGLIVLDTPNDFSFAGQVVIAALIQLGGLGIMSFSTAAFAALGRRLSLRHEAALADLMSGDRSSLFDALRRLLAVTFISEALGAMALAMLFFFEGDPFGSAVWRGVFTSISAFCNAGFALQSDSLIPYAENGAIVNVVAALVITGGLSPPVVVVLPNLLRRRPLPLQARMVLIATSTLLLFGFLVIGALEWSHALAHLSWTDRFNAAWFQSVTLRTAGFNTIDFEALQPATMWVMLGFMFVGGSPGGTAGGVKVTTVAVLLLAVRGAVRGEWEATFGGRRLSSRTFYEAATIVTVAALFVFTAVTALSVTQAIPLEKVVFESFSALATVGLSVGATGALDDVGKVIIMVCMLIGRIGPLTLFLFLRERHAREAWRLPETEVDVG